NCGIVNVRLRPGRSFVSRKALRTEKRKAQSDVFDLCASVFYFLAPLRETKALPLAFGRLTLVIGRWTLDRMSKVPENILSLAEAVRDAGGRALLVGGCVRDELMGRQSREWDLEVYGIEP